MNCICTHGENSHGLKQVRHGTGRVADVARGCLIPGCGCANFVEKKEALRATIDPDELRRRYLELRRSFLAFEAFVKAQGVDLKSE
jgi:hypothetical protein